MITISVREMGRRTFEVGVRTVAAARPIVAVVVLVVARNKRTANSLRFELTSPPSKSIFPRVD